MSHPPDGAAQSEQSDGAPGGEAQGGSSGHKSQIQVRPQVAEVVGRIVQGQGGGYDGVVGSPTRGQGEKGRTPGVPFRVELVPEAWQRLASSEPVP